jgi:hypothetical protein
VRDAIAQRWRRLIGVHVAEPAKPARSSAGNAGHLKSDPDAGQPLTRAPNDATLLARRMAALDLDSYELAIIEAALVHHLQRRCMSCEAWRRCQQDLTASCVDLAWHDEQDWMDYCPNASALKMLTALQGRTKIAPRSSFPYLG